tara:strand:- start:67 stop:684 length:618 start_codon:yes stop_codon:yes gene_type:complete
MNKTLFFIPIFIILAFKSIAKDYEYQQFLSENNLVPVIQSSSNNTVDIIEFSSFSCSHCATFHNETLIEIKDSEVFQNINYYIVDFPLNQAAFYASIVASCDLSIRPNYIDSVYENYSVWTKAESGEQIIDLLNSYGLQHGLGEEQLEMCLKDEDLQNNLLSRQVDSQNIFGVESTPTFIVGGEKVQGNRPASEFIKIISKKLKK